MALDELSWDMNSPSTPAVLNLFVVINQIIDPTNIRLLWTKSRNYLQMYGSNDIMDHGDKSFS